MEFLKDESGKCLCRATPKLIFLTVIMFHTECSLVLLQTWQCILIARSRCIFSLCFNVVSFLHIRQNWMKFCDNVGSEKVFVVKHMLLKANASRITWVVVKLNQHIQSERKKCWYYFLIVIWTSYETNAATIQTKYPKYGNILLIKECKTWVGY